MLVTTFYNGSGLGNQLANYVTVRCLALDKGFKFGVNKPEQFKGKDFMKIDMGEPVIGGFYSTEGQKPEVLPLEIRHWYKETSSGYEDLSKIEDNTMVHGNLQGVDYFKHRKDEVRKWLQVEPLTLPTNLCIIQFRGGEYKYVPDFFLPKSYFEMAMKEMLKTNPYMKFEVHTDDVYEAKKYFPDLNCIHDIGLNWRSIRYAKYLILSNSSFSILPAYLNENVDRVIAPYGFARYNKEYWFLEQNYVKGWEWLHKDGTITL